MSESDSLVDISELQHCVHFELQTVGVEVLEEVNVNSSVDVNGDYFAIAVTSYIDRRGFDYFAKDFLE